MSRLTIAIPAKNEEVAIARALDAFAAQCDPAGSPLQKNAFDVIVLANDCDDGTADVVRRFARSRPPFKVRAVSCELPRDAAHVGTARRIALDLALNRQLRTNGKRGIIASTDADSMVGRTWVWHTLAEMEHVDAIAGHVEVARDERERMAAPLRLRYDRERSYRRLLGDVEAYYDPRPFDPPARHNSLVGASFAVRTATYLEAGRLPAIPLLEDVAFAKALRRIDARIRHSYDIRVETSGRLVARVDGGFASMLADLARRGERREVWMVENAERTVLRGRGRGLLRAFRNTSDAAVASELGEIYAVGAEALRALVDSTRSFGSALDRLEALQPPFESLPDEPIEVASARLREALATAIASSATRKSAASGAG